MVKEFRDFAMRGNVIDLAVGVIIGTAFGKIVGSLVNDILMPLIGLLLGGVNFTGQALRIGEASVKWGMFIQTVIDFIIIAFVIFLIVKAASKVKRQEPVLAPAEPMTKECLFCFSTINIKATRCPNCTSQL